MRQPATVPRFAQTFGIRQNSFLGRPGRVMARYWPISAVKERIGNATPRATPWFALLSIEQCAVFSFLPLVRGSRGAVEKPPVEHGRAHRSIRARSGQTRMRPP